IIWFGNETVKDFLYAALINPGWYGLSNMSVHPDLRWSWEPLHEATIEATSDALSKYNVCIKSEYLQQHVWDRNHACPNRIAAFGEDRGIIYPFLNLVMHRQIPNLSALENQRAYNGLLSNFLRYRHQESQDED
ncbi:hypothetical protein HYDPIDRAFT_171704, partial [Hydnomerulius pinastri MD-312]